ncbi:hypothetical protein RFI_06401 [Reticulomyxa filosa]|uniref:Uncharacterized protein n=1 Tax=Reticulomyxa filosa TaxID=46433 RepID=X6NZJ5_RETFI|nr:hypothetical protein RFI_06401 [Reticulomyxa filosa]|eukprot:ETO30717.1 hypothetical protein RFI_06401 [Reticulomyxa filosa]
MRSNKSFSFFFSMVMLLLGEGFCKVRCVVFVGPSFFGMPSPFFYAWTNFETQTISNKEESKKNFFFNKLTFVGYQMHNCSQVRLIPLLHRIAIVLSGQVGLSLLGIQYILLTFPQSWITHHLLKLHQSTTINVIETYLLILVLFCYCLNIQLVDILIPLCFGFLPILMCIFICGKWNVFILGGIGIALVLSSVIIVRDDPGRRNRLWGIRSIHWFHLLLSFSIYLHTITLMNLSLGGDISLWNSFSRNFFDKHNTNYNTNSNTSC